MNATLNRIFKVIWSRAKLTWVAVSEVVRGGGKALSVTRAARRAAVRGENARVWRSGDDLVLVPVPVPPTPRGGVPRGLVASALVSGSAFATPPAPNALPTGGQVSAGQAGIAQQGAHMVVTQDSARAVIDWQRFDVGSQAHLQFRQPSASSMVLNRVLGPDPSQIFGRISANGQVVLTNPEGIYFGPGARVDVGGLLATTHGISNADFMAGRMRFERQGATGSVTNDGELRAGLGGYVALLAPEVRNQGVIVANMGTAALVAGETVDLRFDANQRLTGLRVEASRIQALVENRHAVQAPGGLVILAAQSLDSLLGGVVRNTGVVEATGLQQQDGGRIVLAASHVAEQAGMLDVSAAAGQGGRVSVQAPSITLADGSRIDATGATGGGAVRVGGGWQGAADPLVEQVLERSSLQATTVTMAAGATVDASAVQRGDGGEVVLWSDAHRAGTVTVAHGSVQARGGTLGGRGGRVETSGATIDIDGFRVDTLAAQGATGLWLIDPFNYTIGPTQAAQIGTALNTSNVTVTTSANVANLGSSGNSNDVGDIILNADITKTGSGTSTLTLQAHRRIVHSGVVRSITSTNGALNVVLWSNFAGSNSGGGVQIGPTITRGGHVFVGGGSSATTWNGLTVPEGPARSFAGGNLNAIDLNGDITTAGGSIYLWGSTGTNGGAGLHTAAMQRTLSAGAGDVTLRADTAQFGSIQMVVNNTGAFNFWSGTGTLGSDTGSFGQVTDLNWFSFTGTPSQFTWGGPANTTDTVFNQLGSGPTLSLTVAGPIRLHGAGVGIDANLTSTAPGAEILLRGTGNVWLSNTRAITTNGGRITMWADADASGQGGIQLGTATVLDSRTNADRTAGTHTSGGGAITLAGGLDDGGTASGAAALTTGLVAGDGLPDGYAVNLLANGGGNGDGTSVGVQIGRTQAASTGIFLRSGGGDIRIHGRSTVAAANMSFGILAYPGYSFDAGGQGNVRLVGVSSGPGVTSAGMDLASYRLMGSQNAASLIRTRDGSITLTGRASAGTGENLGISLDADNSDRVTLAASGTGGITLDGDATGASPNAIRLTSADLLAASGAISLIGRSGSQLNILNWTFNDEVNLGARNASLVTASSSAILLEADTLVLSYPLNVRTSGHFTLRPNGTSFGAALTWPRSNLSVAAGLGGLTLGKAGNTADITIGSAQTVAGPISIFGGNVNLNANLTSTAANAAISVTATGDILQAAGVQVTSNAGAVTYRADADGDTANYGRIRLDTGSGIASAGGDITLGGGTDLATGYATFRATGLGNSGGGDTAAETGAGVDLRNASIVAGAGNVTIRGRAVGTADDYSHGVSIRADNATVDVSGAAVRITGLSDMAGNSSGNGSSNRGISLVESGSGTLVVQGSGNVTLDGTGSAAGGFAVSFNRGVALFGATVRSTGGAVSLTGTGRASGGGNEGILVSPGAQVSSQGGTVTLTGSAQGTQAGMNLAGTLGQSSQTGAIVLRADRWFLPGSNVLGSGTLTIEPLSTSFGTAFSFTGFSIPATLTGLTLGKAGNTADITVPGAVSVAGPISIFGGNVNLNANLTSTAANAAIAVTATGNILHAAGRAVSTNAGNVLYRADSDGSGAGNIALGAGASVQTAGGGIWMGGGAGSANWTPRQGGSAITVGDGAATGSQYGVDIDGASLNAGSTGNIWLSGRSTHTAGNFGVGTRVFSSGSASVASLVGHDITLVGVGGAGSGANFGHRGIDILAQSSGTTSIDAAGSLTITGTGGGSGTTGGGNHGVLIMSAALSSDGNLSVTGAGGGQTGGGTLNNGVHIEASTLESGAGTLTLTGTQGLNGSSVGVRLASTGNVLGHASNQTGAITVRADTMAVAGTEVRGTGTLAIEPLAGSASFTAPLTLDSGWSLASTLTGLTVGKAGNDSNIALAAAIAVNGPISVFGREISITAPITATGSTMRFTGNSLAGFVQTTGAGLLTADSLLLRNVGWAYLSDLGSSLPGSVARTQVGTVAADNVERLVLTNAGALTVGTVAGVQGITANDWVILQTRSGHLDVSRAIHTAYANSLITLASGIATAAGTASGGNVRLTGSTLPAVTTGAAGSVRIYTGSLAGSTGVAESAAGANDGLVAFGSGRFRYNSKFGAHNFTAALGTGASAIYREQPTLTLTPDAQTLVYGDSPALTATVSGAFANGDTAAGVLPARPVAQVFDAANTSAVAAADNGTAFFDAGSYTLRNGSVPATTALGYAVNTSATAALTVTRRAVTITANNDAKIQGETDPGSFSVSFTNLAPGESTLADGTRSVSRAAGETAGNYAITASGVANTNNYAITYAPGTFTVVPVDTLLLTVGPTGATYGSEANYTVTGARYYSSVANQTVHLTLTDATGGGAGNGFIFTDATSNTITLNIDGVGARNASSVFDVGSRGLQASNVVSGIVNLASGVTVTGNLNVAPRPVSLSATRVYDGTRALAGVFATGVGSETLNFTGQANSANVASATHFVAATLADGTGLASNYALPSLAAPAGDNAVSITRRPLSVSATKVYDGATAVDPTTAAVSLGALGGNAASGLVAGETLGVSAASGSSARVAAADKFLDSLTLADGSGLVSNYSLQGLALVAGTARTGLSFAAGVNTLAITPRMLNVTLTNTGVSKVYDGSTAARVGGGVSANAAFVPQFAVTGAVTGDAFAQGNVGFGSAAYDSANVVGATAVQVSGITVSAPGTTGVGSVASDYAWNTTASVAATITPRPVAIAGTGVSKVYDGTTAMTGVSVGFTTVSGRVESGVVTGENLTVSGGVGSFVSAAAGTNVGYTLTSTQSNPLVLTAGPGTLASNYSIPGGGVGTIAGNDGTIFQRPLAITFSGVTRVYDGTTAATVTLAYADPTYAPVSGDVVTVARTATFDSKNAGTGAGRIAITGVSLGGAAAANYTLTYSASNPLHSPVVGSNAGFNASAAGTLLQRDSVTWVGGASGGWFDPANWAATSNLALTGVVPDLANVATVVLPAGVTVNFDGVAAGAAVGNQPVTLAALQGAGATLNVSTGALGVGAGGLTLAGFAQSGGAVSVAGAATIASAFTQTAGTLATTGSGGHLAITQASGALSWQSIATGGHLTLTGAAGVAGRLTTVGGNLVLGAAGPVTQTGAWSVAGTSAITAAGQAVTLQDAANDFGGVVTVTAAATRLRDANALTAVLAVSDDAELQAGADLSVSGTLAGAGSDLTLDAGGRVSFGVTSVAGALSSTTRGAGTAGGVSQTGALNVGGAAQFIAHTGPLQDAVLADAANDFQGPVSFTGASGGSWRDATVRDASALALGNVTVQRDLSARAGTSLVMGTTTVGGDMTAQAGTTLDLGTATVAGNVTAQSNGALNLGTLDAGGNLNANSGNGNITQTGPLTVDGNATLNAGTGDIALSNAANDFGGTVSATADDVTLRDANALVIGTITTTGDLTAQAGTSLVMGTATVGGDMTAQAGTTLDLGTATVAGDVTAQSNGTLNLGTLDAGGNLNANSGNGNITQTGPLTVDGNATLNAGTGDITLSNAANDFGGTVSATADDVALRDANALVIGTVTTTGDLTAQAGTSLVMGTTTVGGDMTAQAGTSLDLGTATVAGNVTAQSNGALNLGTLDAGGNLIANSGNGNITQTGPLTVDGNATLNAGTGDIALSNAANDFGGTVSATADDVTLRDANALVIGTVTTTGDLSAQAGTSLVMGTTTVGGDMTAQAGTTLDLGTATVAGNVTAQSNGALNLGTLDAGGSLIANSGNGNITQTGPLTVDGNATLNAGTGDITLSNAANDFGGTVSATADDVTLRDANALVIGTVTTTGDLSAQAGTSLVMGTTTVGGDMTAQAGTSLVMGTTTVGGDMTAQAGTTLDLGTATVAGDVTAQSNGTLNLGTLDAGGNLNANSGNGNITQTGPLTVDGNATLNAGTGDITLSNAANDFGGTVSATADDVALRDANALVIGTVTATGDLSAQAGTSLVMGTATVGGDMTAQAGTSLAMGTTTVGGDMTAQAGTTLDLGTATVAGDVTAQSNGTLNLGTLDAGGNLNANSGNGNITQTGPLTVDGNATLNAGTGDITLSNAANDFGGTVSATADDVTLRDANALTLGRVTTRGDLVLRSDGRLMLGDLNVGGNLDADSGNGDIGQTAALRVDGTTTMRAGTGAVTLSHPGNRMARGSTVQAGRVVLAGDSRDTVTQMQARSTSSVSRTAASGVNLTTAAAPQVAFALSDVATGTAATVRTDGPGLPQMAVMLLPRGQSVSGMGFSVELPTALRALAAASGEPVRVAEGTQLPDWLRLDAAGLRLEADMVPRGGLPVQLTLTVGGREVLLLISERAS